MFKSYKLFCTKKYKWINRDKQVHIPWPKGIKQLLPKFAHYSIWAIVYFNLMPWLLWINKDTLCFTVGAHWWFQGPVLSCCCHSHISIMSMIHCRCHYGCWYNTSFKRPIKEKAPSENTEGSLFCAARASQWIDLTTWPKSTFDQGSSHRFKC